MKFKNTHGGDITTYMETYHRSPLDFSASISPLGLPGKVKAAVRAAMELPAYPDPRCRRLREAIAKAEGRRIAAVKSAASEHVEVKGTASESAEAQSTGPESAGADRIGTKRPNPIAPLLAPADIICTNGASDLIWRLARTAEKSREALLLTPHYAPPGFRSADTGFRKKMTFV